MSNEIENTVDTDPTENNENKTLPEDPVGRDRQRRGKRLNAVKVFGFILLVLAVNAAMYFGGRPNIPGPTHTYRTYQLNKVFSERRNSIDVAYVGHSCARYGVSSMSIYDEYGIAGYTLSQALFLPWECYETVVDLLNEQDIKVIALEVNNFFYDRPQMYINSYAKRAALAVYPFYESHSWWRDGFKRSERDPYKNFPFWSKATPYNGTVDRSTPKTEVYQMASLHKEYFVKFVSLCRERDIKLALFELPVIKYWSWERHNCINELAEQYDIPFLDMNVGESAERVNIDWKRDYIDAGDHLNYYGSVKTSHELGAWISDLYLKRDDNINGVLPYRKGTAEYRDWDDDLRLYREKAAAFKDRE